MHQCTMKLRSDFSPMTGTWLVELFKGVLGAAFMVNPLHLFCVGFLFFLEVVMGRLAAARREEVFQWREYSRQTAWKLVELSAWLAVVLVITNMTPALESAKTWIMIATAVFLGSRIVNNHLSQEWKDLWMRFKDKVFAADTRASRGRPDPRPVDGNE